MEKMSFHGYLCSPLSLTILEDIQEVLRILIYSSLACEPQIDNRLHC
jgi:hypothetical protein